MSEEFVEIEVHLDDDTYAFVEEAAKKLGITKEQFVLQVLEREYEDDETE